MADSEQPSPPPYHERYTEADFADLCWHDNYIHGFAIRQEQHEADLVIDLDFVLGCNSDEPTSLRYWLSPASLTFKDVTSLKIHVDWAPNGPRCLIHCASIDSIVRIPRLEPPACCVWPAYQWRIDINWPKNGLIEFSGSGFVQTLRSKPVLWDCDLLPSSQRPPFA
jgi:hypothetical protein